MSNYNGSPCPVCKNIFKNGDDIVVCPQCGAPYHRGCYEKEGKCLYESTHGSEHGDWKNPNEKNEKESTKTCPNCKNINNNEALICSKCGFQFNGNNIPNNKDNPFYNRQGNVNNGNNPFNPFGQFGIPFVFDPLGGVGPDETINGEKASDIAKYVKLSVNYYLPEFKKIEKLEKSKFNFPAFIFSGGWLLYRKQYKWGIIITIILAVLLIAGTVLDLIYNQNILQIALNNANLTVSQLNYQTSVHFVNEGILKLEPWQQISLFLPIIFKIINFIIMIVLGFKGNKMYLKSATKKITSLKSKNHDRVLYETKLSETGGVNMPLAISLMFCYAIITYLPYILI